MWMLKDGADLIWASGGKQLTIKKAFGHVFGEVEVLIGCIDFVLQKKQTQSCLH
jgi:hypothetical protein